MTEQQGPPLTGSPLGILLLSNSYEKAHYGFILAAGALASNRPVIMFATNFAIYSLTPQWRNLEGSQMENTHMLSNGVAGLEELRQAVIELEGQLYACEAGMHVASIKADTLLPAVQVCGVVTFLEKTKSGQLISL
ncbi:DsrE/DsrF/DrsH-like family protein [Entomobacter blattae]|uniref:DsrE/DsrF/DrsH-like family protein n=1 Tax=Entomobacter blattae TaxID=2762277 RepID=A0A7H1NPF9_9PROT|nr:DsrE/DsrF/DrsH-like family protein [Entomobacter blattae]QNT77669.1 DsrE/DsrF/DrsH-like family protein [Entomobacter blattae]